MGGKYRKNGVLKSSFLRQANVTPLYLEMCTFAQKMEKVLLSLVIVSTCSLQLMASPTSKTEEVVDTMFLRKQFLKSFQIDDVVICAPYARSVSVYAPLNTSIGKKTLFYNQPRTMPEALQGLAGVWVQKTDHGGGSPIIRGMIGYQTLMLVDGIRLNNAVFQSGPVSYLNTIDGMAMEYAGVLPGAASVAYGSDAMGGVIYMQSQSATFVDSNKIITHGRLIGRAATSGMEYISRGELNLSNKLWAMHLGVDGKRFGDVHAGKGLGIEHPSGYTEWAGDLKIKRRLGIYTVLTAAYQGKRQSHIPTYLQMQSGKYEQYEVKNQARDLSYISYSYRPEDAIIKYVEATLSYARLKNTNWRIPKSTGKSSFSTNDTRSIGATADLGLQVLPCLTIKTGVDIYHDKVFSDGSFPDGSNMLTYAVFVEADATLDKWRIGTGTRYSGHHLSLPTCDFGMVRLSPDAFVGDFHISYELLPHFTVAWIMATSFRAPNINDLAKLGAEDSWYFVPNYNLSPEKGFNKEISIKYDNGYTTLSLNLYRNDLRNMMALTPGTTGDGQTEVAGMPVRMRSNVDKAFLEGFEFAVVQKLGRYFSINGNMAYTYGNNKTQNMPLSKIPPLFGSLSIRYQQNRLRMSMTADMANKQTRLSKQDEEDARIPKGGTPGWMSLKWNVGYELGPVMLAAEWGNIFNKAYRLHASGVDANGIYGKLSVAYLF